MSGKDLSGKAIVFLADGMADNPLDELNGMTPLEAANTPGMDRIAKQGACGTFLTLPEGFPTSSDAANMSVLGYSLAQFYPGRGPIEAVSQGIQLGADDIAFRCNLVFVENGILRDYSAGHIKPEHAKELMNALQQHFGSDKITFHSGVSYRNLLILHGKEFSSKVGYFKPDSSQDMPVNELPWTALDNSAEALHTVDTLNQLYADTLTFLAEQPLVKNGIAKGNAIWPWSPGKQPAFTPFSEKYHAKKGAVITAVDVIAGLGKCANMDVIPVEGATGYIDTNYEGKAAAAIAAIENHDFVYVHLEAIDETSHEGILEKKMHAVEDFDKRIIQPVMSALEGRNCTFAILPDHPVPIKLRAHTRTPVPVAVCGPHIQPDSVEKYNEKTVLQGALGFMNGEQFVRTVLNMQD